MQAEGACGRNLLERCNPARSRDLPSVATRAERVAANKPRILPRYDPKLQAFLDFVLTQYEVQGVGELDQEKLPGLLELKYQTVNDAADALGGIPAIRDAFVGFQRYLYES